LDADLLLKKILIASEKAVDISDRAFGVCFYDVEMEREILREQKIKHELARVAAGDENNGLFLQYQPILDLKSNRVCGFEALARLNSEQLGLVSPMEFIPIAEQAKLIVPIGRNVFLQAFRFLKKLEKEGFDTVNVSVNVSAIQVLRDNFTVDLIEMIREAEVCPENIGIEITESVFSMDYQGINRVLGSLRDSGLHIAIDDFGTGYSSLARERELNVDCLKIDKFFVDKLLTLSPEDAITADIISMAHRLGHCVVAEGVEHEEQKEYLLGNGCDKIQGFLVARPLDEEAALELIRSQAGTGPEST
ncbi:MAG: EAL domain-containing protein, partial [Synergistales bacterium]|nr:EAL domain-containing protein [Synergistales bacterium]